MDERVDRWVGGWVGGWVVTYLYAALGALESFLYCAFHALVQLVF